MCTPSRQLYCATQCHEWVWRRRSCLQAHTQGATTDLATATLMKARCSLSKPPWSPFSSRRDSTMTCKFARECLVVAKASAVKKYSLLAEGRKSLIEPRIPRLLRPQLWHLNCPRVSQLLKVAEANCLAGRELMSSAATTNQDRRASNVGWKDDERQEGNTGRFYIHGFLCIWVWLDWSTLQKFKHPTLIALSS